MVTRIRKRSRTSGIFRGNVSDFLHIGCSSRGYWGTHEGLYFISQYPGNDQKTASRRDVGEKNLVSDPSSEMVPEPQNHSDAPLPSSRVSTEMLLQRFSGRYQYYTLGGRYGQVASYPSRYEQASG